MKHLTRGPAPASKAIKMPPRMRNNVVLAFMILGAFYLFSRNDSTRYEADQSDFALGGGTDETRYEGGKSFLKFVDNVQPAAETTKRPYLGLKSATTVVHSSTSSLQPEVPTSISELQPKTEIVEVASSTSSAAGEQPTSETEEVEKAEVENANALKLQEHYQIEYDDFAK